MACETVVTSVHVYIPTICAAEFEQAWLWLASSWRERMQVVLVSIELALVFAIMGPAGAPFAGELWSG